MSVQGDKSIQDNYQNIKIPMPTIVNQHSLEMPDDKTKQSEARLATGLGAISDVNVITCASPENIFNVTNHSS